MQDMMSDRRVSCKYINASERECVCFFATIIDLNNIKFALCSLGSVESVVITALPSMKITHLLIPFWLSFFSAVANADEIRLEDRQAVYTIGPFAQYFVDDNGEATVDSVSNHSFLPSRQEFLNFGFVKATHWVRFTLSNRSSTSSYRLEVPFPTLNRISFYQPSADGYIAYREGTDLPYRNRTITNEYFVFPVAIAPGETKTFYLSASATNALQIPLVLRTVSAYAEHDRDLGLVWGMYYGILGAMFCLNLALYYVVKQKDCLLYAFYVLFCGLAAAHLNGHAPMLLWPDFTRINRYAITVFAHLMIYFGCHFTRHYLETRRYSRLLDKTITRLANIALLIAFSAVFVPWDLSIVTVYIAAIFCLLIIGAGIYCWFKGSRQAVFLVLGWSTFLAGTGAYAFHSLGILETGFLVIHAKEMGSSIELMMLALGLAHKYDNLRRARRNAETIKVETESLALHREREIGEILAQEENPNLLYYDDYQAEFERFFLNNESADAHNAMIIISLEKLYEHRTVNDDPQFIQLEEQIRRRIKMLSSRFLLSHQMVSIGSRKRNALFVLRPHTYVLVMGLERDKIRFCETLCYKLLQEFAKLNNKYASSLLSYIHIGAAAGFGFNVNEYRREAETALYEAKIASRLVSFKFLAERDVSNRQNKNLEKSSVE
jgi:hypothetical protein